MDQGCDLYSPCLSPVSFETSNIGTDAISESLFLNGKTEQVQPNGTINTETEYHQHTDMSPIETGDRVIDPKDLLDQHLVQSIKHNDDNDEEELFESDMKSDIESDQIYFDKCIYSAGDEHHTMAMISSNGFSSGKHEWLIEILKCDVSLQEIGIISCDIDDYSLEDIKVSHDGIRGTEEYGARACYGNELATDSMYYGSWNASGKERCFRDLADKCHIGWCTGDIIKVVLDCNKWRMKYYLNGKRVRKSMSLEKGKTYYPIIQFSGNCQYCVVSQ